MVTTGFKFQTFSKNYEDRQKGGTGRLTGRTNKDL